MTYCKFIPSPFFRKLGNGTCTALKENLLIEGYINQNIEYAAILNKNTDSIQRNSLTHFDQLRQKMQIIINHSFTTRTSKFE